MNDIDKLLEELESENNLVESKEEPKEVVKVESEIPNIMENEEVMTAIFKMAVEDRKKADDAYEIFAPEISTRKDNTTASKEAMMRAIELKIASAKNIIDMMKLNNKKESSVGIFMGDVFGENKAGISIKNLSDENDD